MGYVLDCPNYSGDPRYQRVYRIPKIRDNRYYLESWGAGLCYQVAWHRGGVGAGERGPMAQGFALKYWNHTKILKFTPNSLTTPVRIETFTPNPLTTPVRIETFTLLLLPYRKHVELRS